MPNLDPWINQNNSNKNEEHMATKDNNNQNLIWIQKSIQHIKYEIKKTCISFYY